MSMEERRRPLVGLGFLVFMLLTPVLFLGAWLIGSLSTGSWTGVSLQTAVLVGSWSGAAGVAMASLGYLIAGEFGKNFVALAVQAMLPIVGFVYAYGHGYAWSWTFGWLIFALIIADLTQRTLVVQQPSMFSYEHAKQLLTSHASMPLVPRLTMLVLQSFTVVGLGIFLLGSNAGLGGIAVVGPLSVAIVAGVLNGILMIRYRRFLMPQQV